MQRAFRRGDRDAGIAIFIDYVFNDPHAWDKMPEPARRETLRDARVGCDDDDRCSFPAIEPLMIRKITAPVLLLSGAKSYPFLGLVTEELARLLPNSETIVLPDAGHPRRLASVTAISSVLLPVRTRPTATITKHSNSDFSSRVCESSDLYSASLWTLLPKTRGG
jgi:hypothetical protein